MKTYSRHEALAAFTALPIVALIAAKPRKNRLAEVEAAVTDMQAFAVKVKQASMAERASAAWQECASQLVIANEDEVGAALAEAVSRTIEAIDALEM